MKFLDKSKLYIIKTHEGGYAFDYNPNLTFDFSEYKEKIVTNMKTGEKIKYEDLIFNISKEEAYLYPQEFFRTNKVIEDYNVTNWFFEDDPRAIELEKETLFDNFELLIKGLVPKIESFSTSLEKFYNAGLALVSSGKDIHDEFVKHTSGIDTAKFKFKIKK